MSVKIGNISKEIASQLASYTSEVKGEVIKATDEVSKGIVDELKLKSPNDTGIYAKGWRRKKQGEGYIVHNSTDYQLTHLLEHGHVKINGGRVPAKVHIRPVEEKAVKEFESRVERAIKR